MTFNTYFSFSFYHYILMLFPQTFQHRVLKTESMLLGNICIKHIKCSHMDVGYIKSTMVERLFSSHVPRLAFHSYQLQINLDEEKVFFIPFSMCVICEGYVWTRRYMMLYRWWWWWHTIYSRCARAKRYWNYNGGEGKFLYDFFFLHRKYWKMVKRMVYLRRKFYWFVTSKDLIFDVNLIWKKTVMCELIYLISVRQKGCNSLWSRHYFRLINLSKYNIKSSIEQHIEFVSIDSMTIANNLFSFYFEATVSKHVNRCSFNIRFKKNYTIKFT